MTSVTRSLALQRLPLQTLVAIPIHLRSRPRRLCGTRRVELKKVALSILLALSSLSGVAQAFDICPPRRCAPPPGDGGGGSSVPEPATLALLGAGIAAVGVAAARRRKKKKDDAND